MHDLVIRGGTIVDGSGEASFSGDVAVDNGRITQVGGTAGPGTREIDAAGAIVTPGWVDLHTHYDGQVTWDPFVSPSSWHGVTTVVMGNCGVGFAPVAHDQHDELIKMMEGVEDIPGAALHEGMTWGWETFPQYLDKLASIPRSIDIGAQVPHCAVRAYAMGDKGIANEPASEADIERMAGVVRAGIDAGALGFTTTRTVVHRTSDGRRVPGTFADEAELIGIGKVLGELGKGVFGMITDFDDDEEGDLKRVQNIAKANGRPIWMSLIQKDYAPGQWRRVLDFCEKSTAEGTPMFAQVAGRPVGLMLGLEGSLNPFSSRPSFRRINHLSLEEKVATMHDPEFRKQLLSEWVEHKNELMKDVTSNFAKMFRLGDPPNYEPEAKDSIAAEAERKGLPSQDVLYDMLLERDGRELVFFPLVNFTDGNHDKIREMLMHPRTLVGLGDGGAHCGVVCDASIPTFMLTHWTRDRSRGERLPLEWVVKAQTNDTASFIGLHDRGRLAPGLKADINVIDMDKLYFTPPQMLYDLPAGGRRLVQKTKGYIATIVAGEVALENGAPTDARPGKLVRGGQAA